VATIAEGLRATGVDVLECNAPLGLDTKSRVAALASPSKVPALLLRIARRWTTLARAARKMPLRPDVVLVGYMGHFDVHLAKLLFRKVPIVLDHLIGASDTARDRRLDAGPRQKLMGMIDSGALRKADVILVDTDEHLAALPDRYRERAVVVPVGAPEAWFTAAAARADADAEAAVTAELSGEQAEVVGPLRVVFFGLYTPLQGAPVIGAALGSLAGEPIEVTMVGTGQDETETKTAAAANKAVRWLDWVASSQVTRCAWASSAPARRHCGSCRTRSSRVRPQAAPSSPRTPRRSAARWVTPSCTCLPATRQPSRTRCARWPPTAPSCPGCAGRPATWSSSGSRRPRWWPHCSNGSTPRCPVRTAGTARNPPR
jgi:hypothetical protein